MIKYFSHIDTPQVKLCDAIRVSIGIPLLFTSVLYQGKRYCDGGIMNNFPINIVSQYPGKTIGLKLISTHVHSDHLHLFHNLQ